MKEKFLLEDYKKIISKFSFDYGITRIDKIQEDIGYKYPNEPNEYHSNDFFRLLESLISNKDKHQDFIDLNKIKNEYFSEIEADIFISYSSLDIVDVRNLAAWIKEFTGLTCFVDSIDWKHYKDIIQEYMDENSVQDIVDTTSKAAIILLISLLEVIQKSKAVFFIKTENSMSDDNSTLSPWIWFENKMLADIADISDDFKSKLQENILRLKENIKIRFDIDTSHYYKMDMNDLKIWLDTCKKEYIKGPRALDKLLDIVKNKRGGFIKNP